METTGYITCCQEWGTACLIHLTADYDYLYQEVFLLCCFVCEQDHAKTKEMESYETCSEGQKCLKEELFEFL